MKDKTEERTEYVPIKCHACKKVLRAGQKFTLECECGWCNIQYNKYGDIVEYEFWFFKGKKEYAIIKHQYSRPFLSHNSRRLISLDVEMKFEDGVPQVERMYNKMRTMIVFS